MAWPPGYGPPAPFVPPNPYSTNPVNMYPPAPVNMNPYSTVGNAYPFSTAPPMAPQPPFYNNPVPNNPVPNNPAPNNAWPPGYSPNNPPNPAWPPTSSTFNTMPANNYNPNSNWNAPAPTSNAPGTWNPAPTNYGPPKSNSLPPPNYQLDTFDFNAYKSNTSNSFGTLPNQFNQPNTYNNVAGNRSSFPGTTSVPSYPTNPPNAPIAAPQNTSNLYSPYNPNQTMPTGTGSLGLNSFPSQSSLNTGVSPMQAQLLKTQQEEQKRQQAIIQAQKEAEAQKAAIEALQREELLEAQRRTFMHQIEMDRIAAEAKAASDELDRKQRELMTAEAKRKQEELLKQQQEKAAIEAKIRAERIKQQELEESRLKAEQEKLDAQQRALASQAQQLASHSQMQQQAQQREEQKRQLESQQLQKTFYSSILDIIKLLATTNQRISKLITLNYKLVVTRDAPEQQFLLDLCGHLEKTGTRLTDMITENVLGIEDDVHLSVSAETQNLSSSVSSLISFCRRIVPLDGKFDEDMMHMSDEERISHARKRSAAVTSQIMSLIEILERMKMEEASNTAGTKVLSAGSLEEAKANVEANIQAQAGQRGAIQASLGVAVKKPYQPPANFSPDSIDIGYYSRPENLAKVKVLQNAISSWTVRTHFSRILEQISSSKDGVAIIHRKKLLSEICSTEASYFQSLDLIVNFFYKPLYVEASKPNGIITQEEFKGMFSTIQEIHAFSKKLLAEFDSRLQKWPTVQLFGDIFLDFVDEMMIYSDYINGFDEAVTIHKRLSMNPKFVAFEQECMKATGKRLDLPSLLIQPVQRMPRYGLLLKELINYSTPDHIDYANLIEARTRVNEVCVAINHKKLEYDNKIAIQKISQEVIGMDAIRLDASKHLFMLSTFIQWESDQKSDAKQWTRAYLFNDMIIFAKAKSVGAPGPYQFFESLELPEMSVVQKKGHKKSFVLYDASGTRKLERILHFTEELVCSQWLKDMKETIQTSSLQKLLNEDLNEDEKKVGLTLLAATYGDLSSPPRTIDVTYLLQKMVNKEGGKSLTLPPTPKSKLPGFIDPCKSKKKSLLIVYRVGDSPPKTKTFQDESPVNIKA